MYVYIIKKIHKANKYFILIKITVEQRFSISTPLQVDSDMQVIFVKKKKIKGI